MTIYAVTADGIPMIFFHEYILAWRHLRKCQQEGVHALLRCNLNVTPITVHKTIEEDY